MSTPEEIVRAREAAKRQQEQAAELQKNAPLFTEMQQLASEALTKLRTLGFPEMKIMTSSHLWEGERYVAWQLIDYYDDGFSEEVYLLSTGIVVMRNKLLLNERYTGVWIRKAIAALKHLKAGNYEVLPLKR